MIEQAFDYSPNILVEEFIRGTEATCGVLENWRDQDVYALPPIEIRVPEGKELFDYDVKYTELSHAAEICPGGFCEADTEKIKRLAIAAHKVLDLRHYSRADFIVSPTRGIYLLEVNTLPGLHALALIPKAAKVEGLDYEGLLDHIISLALK